MLPPEYEQAVSKHIRATTTTLAAGHVPMLPKPEEVAAVIIEAASKSVPPLPGVLGQVKSVTPNSIEIGTKSGVVSLKITQPLTTYRQVPSDLSQVTADSYCGVASDERPDGTEVAKQILIFPAELRGAAEGSVLLDAPAGAVSHSRMTNGSPCDRYAVLPPSRTPHGRLHRRCVSTTVC